MDKKTYPVKAPIRHNGELYKVGSAIELTDDEAAALPVYALGDAVAAPAIPTGAEREAAIKAAIVSLDTTNKDLFTATGEPATAAIMAITGWPVSAAERSVAWAAAQAI